MNALTWFKKAISDCQQQYQSMLNLKARTNDALYEAIKRVYALDLEIQKNGPVRDAFHQELKSNKMRKGPNETLTLVELAFIPHVLFRKKKHDPEDRKADIDKASLYAKVISYARAHKVNPGDLIKFIRDNGGIEAIADAETDRCPRRAKRTGVRLGKSLPATVTGGAPTTAKPPRPRHRPLPLLLWCSDDMITQVIQRTSDAYYTDFIIHGRLDDTNNGIVTSFCVVPHFPLPKPPSFIAKRQPNGKRSPISSRESASANEGDRIAPPLSKRMRTQVPGPPPTRPGKTQPLGKTPPVGKASPAGKTVNRRPELDPFRH